MEFRALLAFVDECDVSDADDPQPLRPQQQQELVRCAPVARSPSSEGSSAASNGPPSKTRPRRIVQELTSLQTQATALTLELDTEKQIRRKKTLLLTEPSPWRTECDRQSRLRAAAQSENEQLRDKLQAQTKKAKRLVNLLKRCPTSQALDTILRFENDARLRAKKIDLEFDELDHAYFQTDAVLDDAEMASLPGTHFDAQIRQQIGQQSFFIELRRRLLVAHDRDTTSEAYWRFSPHPSFSKRFIFEHTESYLGDTRSHAFAFETKQGPSKNRFHGQYLMRKYRTEERVTIVWKMIIEPEGSSPYQLGGRGWAAIYGSNAHGEGAFPSPFTSVSAVARFYPESKLGAVVDRDHVQQDADLQAIIEFVIYAGEGYAAFASQMALTHDVVSMELPAALLAFVDECELSDAEQQQQVRASASADSSRLARHPSRQRFGCSSTKTRPRRDVVEIAVLQKMAAALTLELEHIKQARANESTQLLADEPSHWQAKAERQSRLRATSQQENERLRAKVQAQKHVARRLVNVLKSRSTSQILDMLRRYERDAKLRAQTMEEDDLDDFDCIYNETDAVLADAAMSSLPSAFFDARMRQLDEQVLVEFRTRMHVERDCDATSDEYWRFVPHHSFTKRFIIERVTRSKGDTLGHTLCFRSKNGQSRTRFRGRYQLRRYVTDERVVITWKVLVRPEGRSSREGCSHLQLRGRGWAVFHSITTAQDTPSTSIQTIARFFPESTLHAALTLDHVQHDADLKALVEFVTCAAEGYAAFTSHVVQQQ